MSDAYGKRSAATPHASGLELHQLPAAGAADLLGAVAQPLVVSNAQLQQKFENTL